MQLNHQLPVHQQHKGSDYQPGWVPEGDGHQGEESSEVIQGLIVNAFLLRRNRQQRDLRPRSMGQQDLLIQPQLRKFNLADPGT